MTFTVNISLPASLAPTVAELVADDATVGADAVDVNQPGAEAAVIVYFSHKPAEAARLRIAAIAREIIGAPPPAATVTELPETDWVAKSLAGLAPVRAGRFLVHGSHDRDRPRPNDIAIEIDAGQAFGTGHHGSTTGCLLAIDRLSRARRFRNALDLGTGSGVLAIAIARSGHGRVLASDIDPVAVAVARENVRRNRVAAEVHLATAAGLAGAAFRRRAPFDLIVANILAGPLVALAPAIRRSLAPGGALVLSGLLVGQRARVVAAYRAQGLRLISDWRDGEWLTLTLRRPGRRAIRPPRR